MKKGVCSLAVAAVLVGLVASTSAYGNALPIASLGAVGGTSPAPGITW